MTIAVGGETPVEEVRGGTIAVGGIEAPGGTIAVGGIEAPGETRALAAMRIAPRVTRSKST